MRRVEIWRAPFDSDNGETMRQPRSAFFASVDLVGPTGNQQQLAEKAVDGQACILASPGPKAVAELAHPTVLAFSYIRSRARSYPASTCCHRGGGGGPGTARDSCIERGPIC